jgi:hypothetical protein
MRLLELSLMIYKEVSGLSIISIIMFCFSTECDVSWGWFGFILRGFKKRKLIDFSIKVYQLYSQMEMGFPLPMDNFKNMSVKYIPSQTTAQIFRQQRKLFRFWMHGW